MPCNGVNIFSYMVLNARKLVFGAEGANSKGTDLGGPICAFVIRLLESIISELASSEILIFQLVSVAEQAGLNLNKTSGPYIFYYYIIRLLSGHSHLL